MIKNLIGRLLTLAAVFSCVFSFAYIPPVPLLLKEIFDGRKPKIAVEAVFRHRVETRSGEPYEIEEKILSERGQALILWKGPGMGPIAATYDGKNYALSRDKTYPVRSNLFMKYFFSDSAEEFKETLLSEQFVRRDQLLEYKPGFIPNGDPALWNLRQNYLRHDDIFLQRLQDNLTDISIAVQGTHEGTTLRAVYFDRSFKGISRLEWRDGDQWFGWDFEGFARFSADGIYPRRLSFGVQGVEAISSQLVSWRPVRDRQLSEFKSNWKQVARGIGSLASAEPALKLLLSYR
jgi:hypothetical protein